MDENQENEKIEKTEKKKSKFVMKRSASTFDFSRPKSPISLEKTKATTNVRIATKKKLAFPKPDFENISTSAKNSPTLPRPQQNNEENENSNDESSQQLLPVSSYVQCVPCVATETVAAIIRGEFPNLTHIVVDCRYDYEYNGGHIRNAINYSEPDKFLEKFFNNNFGEPEKVVLIFHCEYSTVRGPNMAQILRDADRNRHIYPQLLYPHVYILEAGYRKFYESFPELCDPKGYVEMYDKRFTKQMLSKSHLHRRHQSQPNIFSYKNKPLAKTDDLILPKKAFSETKASKFFHLSDINPIGLKYSLDSLSKEEKDMPFVLEDTTKTNLHSIHNDIIDNSQLLQTNQFSTNSTTTITVCPNDPISNDSPPQANAPSKKITIKLNPTTSTTTINNTFNLSKSTEIKRTFTMPTVLLRYSQDIISSEPVVSNSYQDEIKQKKQKLDSNPLSPRMELKFSNISISEEPQKN